MYIYLYISCMYIYHTYIFFFTMYQPVLGCTSTVMMSAIPIPRFGFDLWSFVRLHRLLARHGRRANLRLHRRFFFFGWGTRRFMAFKMPERSVLFLIQAYPATILARWPPIAMELKYTSVVWEVSHKIQHSRNLA